MSDSKYKPIRSVPKSPAMEAQPKAVDPTPLDLLHAGCSIMPVMIRADGRKMPLVGWKKFQSYPASAEQVVQWEEKFHPQVWGMITGQVSGRFTLDFDGDTGRALIDQLGLKPHRRTGSGGFHVDVETPEGWPVKTMAPLKVTDDEESVCVEGLDIRGEGGCAAVLGHNAKGPYKWLRDPNDLESLDSLPDWLLELLRAASKDPEPEWKLECRNLVRQLQDKPLIHIPGRNGSSAKIITVPTAAAEAVRVSAQTLVQRALKQSVGGRNEAGFRLAQQLRDNNFSNTEAEAAMGSYQGQVQGRNTKGELEPYTIEEAMASLHSAYAAPPREPWAVKLSAGAQNVPFTDLGNSDLFVAAYQGTLRYCPPIKKFLVWDGKRWEIDQKLRAEKLAKAFIRQKVQDAVAEAKIDPERLKHFLRSEKDNAIRAMMHLAQPDLVVTPEELDTHPDLLNFKNGTLDLRTGELRPHSQVDYMTKLVQYNYDLHATCPLWENALHRSMGSEADPERAERLVRYLQVAFGYSLTGRTTDKAVFFAVGPGGDNGKTTILNAFRHCIYEYATTLQAETLFNKFETSNTQADLADLRGARFAMTSELDEGSRLREGKLKRITQGMGKIKGTRKYENPTTFEETHKLWIDTNHRPEIRGTDDAMWRRLHLIPFEVKIPKAEQDQELMSKLNDEAEGILAWAVQGALLWYAQRLQPPPEVLSARNKYRREQDQIGRFIADNCIINKQGETGSTKLYKAYQHWCKDNGEENCISHTSFGRRLADLGHKKYNDGHGVVYLGLQFKHPEQDY